MNYEKYNKKNREGAELHCRDCSARSAGYIIYLYVSYIRIPDNQELTVETISEKEKAGDQLTTGQKYSALTYNVGFGAYTPDFSFFMDGGKSSWAKSKESVKETIKGAGELVASRNPDFALLQEVDLNSTRSYHVDEYSVLKETIPAYDSVFAQNYDSAFLFYPFTQPHGKKQVRSCPVFKISCNRFPEKKFSGIYFFQ